MVTAKLKIDESKVLNSKDLAWLYRLINEKISTLESTRSGPTPPHVHREANELRELSSKLWSLDEAIASRKY